MRTGFQSWHVELLDCEPGHGLFAMCVLLEVTKNGSSGQGCKFAHDQNFPAGSGTKYSNLVGVVAILNQNTQFVHPVTDTLKFLSGIDQTTRTS
jgi:hypothetical protein